MCTFEKHIYFLKYNDIHLTAKRSLGFRWSAFFVWWPFKCERLQITKHRSKSHKIIAQKLNHFHALAKVSDRIMIFTLRLLHERKNNRQQHSRVCTTDQIVPIDRSELAAEIIRNENENLVNLIDNRLSTKTKRQTF